MIDATIKEYAKKRREADAELQNIAKQINDVFVTLQELEVEITDGDNDIEIESFKLEARNGKLIVWVN